MSHPAVDLARAAAVRGDRLIQFTLTLSPPTVRRPPTLADDVNLVLNKVAAHGCRSWTGWHRHATLVTAAHLFITLLRHDPKAAVPA
jgi:hypothetical protein